MAKKEFNRDTSIFMELVRFVIIGLYGTLIDFAIEGWVTSIASSKTASMGHVAAFFVMFAISILGFAVATPATWSLTAIWGFRNVEEESAKKSKTLKGSLQFAFWAFLGLLIGAVIQFIGYMTCIEWTGLNIDILGGFDFQKMFVEGQTGTFLAWLIVMVIRTAFTMTFNYITRKFILFKAPKAPTE